MCLRNALNGFWLYVSVPGMLESSTRRLTSEAGQSAKAFLRETAEVYDFVVSWGVIVASLGGRFFILFMVALFFCIVVVFFFRVGVGG